MDKVISPGRVEGRLKSPSSKSYVQRAIAAALLSGGRTVISGLEMCDDTRSALSIAEMLGADIEIDLAEGRCAIKGGLSPRRDTIDAGESGLAARLFTPIAALCGQRVTITGRGSLLVRPMGMMASALRELGAEVSDTGGLLPITVRGPLPGGQAHVDGSISSQFITGLLLALPCVAHDTALHVAGLKSIPYINMTIALADSFGVRIEHRDYQEFFIPGSQSYLCEEYAVEGDWSAASCLLVAGAVAGGITLDNLNPLSMQADAAIIDALSRAGARVTTSHHSVTVERATLEGFEFDATHCPDLFPALVALAANCRGTSSIKGTDRLLGKESNRAETLRGEYARLGIEVDISQPDVMRITGGRIYAARCGSHNDHRIAMSLAVAALNASGPVTVAGAECVAKSYPRFWDDIIAVIR